MELRDVDALPPLGVSVTDVRGWRAAVLGVTNRPEIAERYCLLDLPRFFRAVSRSWSASWAELSDGSLMASSSVDVAGWCGP